MRENESENDFQEDLIIDETIVSGEISNNDNYDNKKFHVFKTLIANARSMNNKIGSLIEAFEEFQLSVALISETWFKNGSGLDREMNDLLLSDGIGMITRNRGGRGGGVAIAFRSSEISLKEFKIPENKYEMVKFVASVCLK